MTERPDILTLRGLTKSFGNFSAVDGIDLDVAEGEFVTIVGPSGSGKTTLLRMLAGLETPTSGEIRIRGTTVNDVPANRRPTCLVFQSLALFPHQSVGENIGFPLKIKGVAAAERKARALELMRLLRLPESYFGKNVMQCSGGERQRVALARALAYDPEILFFDEPLSAIDYKLRKTLEKELKDIHRETHKTFIYITHSLEEAMVMSDRIGVMRAGKLVQVGTPNEIYTAPETKFVSEFMGDVNILRGEGGCRRQACRDRLQRDLPRAEAGERHDQRPPRDPAGVPCASSRSRERRRTASKAASTTNTRSARASSIRCASASRCSSWRSSASRPIPESSTMSCGSAGIRAIPSL